MKPTFVFVNRCIFLTILNSLLITIVPVNGKFFYEKPLIPPPVKDKYEFWLTIATSYTMILTSPNPGETHGTTSTIFHYDVDKEDFYPNISASNHVPQWPREGAIFNSLSTAERFATGDGLLRQFHSVNGSLPGPCLLVREQSEVIVHVTNNLPAEEITIHWHGIHQPGQNVQDGVGLVTQWPIRSGGQSFTYRFHLGRDQPSGTYWYHEHHSSLRSDGIHGAFVVFPRPDDDKPSNPPISTDPVIESDKESEYMMVLSDFWSQLSSTSPIELMVNKLGHENEEENSETLRYQADGAQVGESVQYSPILVNGNGWHNLEDLETRPMKLPLTAFEVKTDESYKFRLLNLAGNLPFLVSIENHRLTLIASDGSDIDPVDIDQLIIFPGERYDFRIRTLSNPDRRFYYVAIRSLGFYNASMKPLKQQLFTLVMLDYADAHEAINDDANEHRTFDSHRIFDQCSPTKRCLVFNCPFKHFRGFESKVRCVDATYARSLDRDLKISASKSKSKSTTPVEIESHSTFFLNFYNQPQINDYIYQHPSASLGLYPDLQSAISDGAIHPCPKACPHPPCKCTPVMDVSLNSTVDVVLFSKSNGAPADGAQTEAFAHPVHFHGLSFQVLMVGYPEYDPKTGLISEFSQDIACDHQKPTPGKHHTSGAHQLMNHGLRQSCNHANGWATPEIAAQLSHSSASNSYIRKDTVTVPVGGYVVIRFRADNPGWWAAHCHMVAHSSGGMMFLLHVGNNGGPLQKPYLDWKELYPAVTNQFIQNLGGVSGEEKYQFGSENIGIPSNNPRISLKVQLQLDNLDKNGTGYSMNSMLLVIGLALIVLICCFSLIGVIVAKYRQKSVSRTLHTEQLSECVSLLPKNP